MEDWLDPRKLAQAGVEQRGYLIKSRRDVKFKSKQECVGPPQTIDGKSL